VVPVTLEDQKMDSNYYVHPSYKGFLEYFEFTDIRGRIVIITLGFSRMEGRIDTRRRPKLLV
jgi:hypothetical protein